MDKNWKNKIVHLSAIHSITFESTTNLPPIGKQDFFIAKRNSSSYNIAFSMSNWEKVPLPSKSITFIQKGWNRWAAQKYLLGFPTLRLPKLYFSSKYYIFIQKGETIGIPKMTLGLPNFSPPKNFP